MINWILTQLSRVLQRKATERKLKNSVKMEIAENKQRLQEYWKEVKPGDEADENFRVINSLERMNKIPLPQLSHKLFDSATSKLAAALNNEQIQEVLDSYMGFDRISSIYSELLNKGFYLNSTLDEAKRNYERFEKAIIQVLKNNNPIKD